MSKFLLEIITPERIFFQENIEMLIVRGSEGDIGIMKDHEPFVTQLGIGRVIIKNEGNNKVAALSQGYLKVSDERVIILSDTAEWPDEIDVVRAQKARERAEKRLMEKQEGIDLLRAEIALKKAVARIGVSNIPNKH